MQIAGFNLPRLSGMETLARKIDVKCPSSGMAATRGVHQAKNWRGLLPVLPPP